MRAFRTLRPMWRASIDALLQAEHNPTLRELLAAGQEEGRRGGAAGLLGVAEVDVPPEAVRTLGSVYPALLSGVMLQWLLDPDTAPSGAEVVAGLRAMAELAGPGTPAEEGASGGESTQRAPEAPTGRGRGGATARPGEPG